MLELEPNFSLLSEKQVTLWTKIFGADDRVGHPVPKAIIAQAGYFEIIPNSMITKMIYKNGIMEDAQILMAGTKVAETYGEVTGQTLWQTSSRSNIGSGKVLPVWQKAIDLRRPVIYVGEQIASANRWIGMIGVAFPVTFEDNQVPEGVLSCSEYYDLD